MPYSQSFLDNVDINPVGSIVQACEECITSIESNTLGWNNQELTDLMEAAALVNEIIESHKILSENSLPEICGNLENNCQMLFQYLSNVREEFKGRAYEIQFEAIQSRYNAAMKKNFAYEFSQGDIERVQVLINELRDRISSISELESAHKHRLLSRLEKLQSELHKRVSDLDRFWGLVGDAGVVLGKLGRDAKPIVDRIREIADIVWRTQSRAEELPSGTKPPLLENSEE